MTVTARYIAWLDKIRLSKWMHLRLALMETALLFAWAVLLDSILRLFTNLFLNALPVTMLIAANLLAWLESPRVSRLADPLTALGLAEVDDSGKIPPGWRTLLRVILTPPSLLILMTGFIPVFFGRRSLPEAAAGVKLVSLDPSHDPRSLNTILDLRNRNRKTVLGYTFLSLAIAAVILFVPLPEVSVNGTGSGKTALGISAEDTELLTLYLEMTERFPDSIEYHVRLASLYYRNAMDADLAGELREIARLDPQHPMLLLSEDTDVDLSDLIPPGERFPEISDTGFGPGMLDVREQPDSTADSTGVRPAPEDVDSTPPLSVDSLETAPEEPVQSQG